MKLLKTYIYELLLVLISSIYFIYFTAASFLRYDNYYTGRFDLGNMAQTVWNTVHGNIFQLTDPNGTESVSRLAFHADFILILLSPFYFLWENPKMLLLIQTAVLTFGGIFVYLISKEVLKNKGISLTLALAFFLNPAVNYTNLYDFHSVTLATTFLLGAFYFLLKRKYLPMLILLVLAGISKEQVWAIIALIGLYLAVFKKERRLGLSITLASALIFYLLVWIAIPKALGSQHFAISYYSDFGDSPTKIVKNIIFSPIKTLETALLPDRIAYLKQIFLPMGYLFIFAPFFLIFAAPDLTIGLLSSNPTLHQIYYQYSATITPFIFLSVIFALSRIRKKMPELSFGILGTVILVMTLLSAYDYGPLPYAKKPNTSMFDKPTFNRSLVDDYLKSLPLNESISATNSLGSHLSHRKHIYTIPQGMDKADKVIILADRANPSEKSALGSLLNDPNYILLLSQDNFYVFGNISK